MTETDRRSWDPRPTSRLPSSELMLLLVFGQVLALAIEPNAPWGDLMNLGAAVLIAGLLRYMTGYRRDGATYLALSAVGPLLNFVVPWEQGPLVLDLVKVAFWTAAPAFLALRILGLLARRRDVGRPEIAGAVTSYLLIGLVFANVYELLFMVDPQALRFVDDFKGEHLGFGEILYFSYVTLTTVGYGDVSPAHPAARMVAIVEAITGLMLVSIVIARFVGLHTARASHDG